MFAKRKKRADPKQFWVGDGSFKSSVLEPQNNEHGVYELVPISSVPPSQKAVDTRWVNKIKADRTIKNRLAVQGWFQVPSIDYDGTFAPYRKAAKRSHFAVDRGRER